jgi:hypothetical protein
MWGSDKVVQKSDWKSDWEFNSAYSLTENVGESV